MLQARAVSYRVGTQRLLHDVSFDLRPGELVCVIGPNGAGKSTLMRVLAGERAPTSGEVLYDGRAIADIPIWDLACMRAVLAQSTQVFLPLRVHEVASLGLDGFGRRRSVGDREAIVAAAMATAEVAHLAGRPYQRLSGGEQQRVQFARVLCQLAAGRSTQARQVLFLDEPTASLDLNHQIALLDTARRLAGEGLGVVTIMHDLNMAAAYADRLVVIEEGRIVAEGAPVTVLTDGLLADVFRVDLRVGAVPDGSVPFVLPRVGRP